MPLEERRICVLACGSRNAAKSVAWVWKYRTSRLARRQLQVTPNNGGVQTATPHEYTVRVESVCPEAMHHLLTLQDWSILPRLTFYRERWGPTKVGESIDQRFVV